MRRHEAEKGKFSHTWEMFKTESLLTACFNTENRNLETVKIINSPANAILNVADSSSGNMDGGL